MRKIFLIVACVGMFNLFGGTLAHACLEGIPSIVSTEIRNSCPYTVNVTWCFGRDCVPPSGGKKLSPGRILKISNYPNKPYRASYCKYPKKIVERSGERGCG